ncbi:fatty acid desaturase CarF family protein [Persicimonas caeni]|nr:fatty acid desaturase CarF family protein [Persicimonas caeni]
MNSLGHWWRASSAHYEYSPSHRFLEILAIAAAIALMVVMSWRLLAALASTASLLSWACALGAGLVGYVAADFVSGMVHWLADRFGTPDTPVLGEAFIRPFREHHDFPKRITHHDFVEVNGNNSLVLLLVLAPAAWMLPAQLDAAWLAFGSFFVSFPLAIFMTNQFHKWAHMDEVPAVVAWMQRRGLILSPRAHDRHHTAPFETDYCITSGWLNPLLERFQLFARCERFLRRRPPQQTPAEHHEPACPPPSV